MKCKPKWITLYFECFYPALGKTPCRICLSLSLKSCQHARSASAALWTILGFIFTIQSLCLFPHLKEICSNVLFACGFVWCICRSRSAAQLALEIRAGSKTESWQLAGVAELRLPKISLASCTGFVGMYYIQLPFRSRIQNKQDVGLIVLRRNFI